MRRRDPRIANEEGRHLDVRLLQAQRRREARMRPQFATRPLGQEDVKMCEEMLAAAEEYKTEENARRMHKDWSFASESDTRRLTITLAALKAGAEVVEPWKSHGVTVNRWLVIAVNSRKWTYKFDTWYPFGSLETLLQKHVTSKMQAT